LIPSRDEFTIEIFGNTSVSKHLIDEFTIEIFGNTIVSEHLIVQSRTLQEIKSAD